MEDGKGQSMLQYSDESLSLRGCVRTVTCPTIKRASRYSVDLRSETSKPGV